MTHLFCGPSARDLHPKKRPGRAVNRLCLLPILVTLATVQSDGCGICAGSILPAPTGRDSFKQPSADLGMGVTTQFIIIKSVIFRARRQRIPVPLQELILPLPHPRIFWCSFSSPVHQRSIGGSRRSALSRMIAEHEFRGMGVKIVLPLQVRLVIFSRIVPQQDNGHNEWQETVTILVDHLQ